MDMISSLPDDILHRILSFLPIKEATALTCVLSKRWRNLFAFRQDLCLAYVDHDFWNPKTNKSFVDFVDRVLAVSGDFTVRKLSLKIRQSIEPAHISRWMSNLLSRGIADIDLDHSYNNNITLPLEMFTCKTLVKLKLGCLFKIDVIPENASFPALKTLLLDCIRFSDYGFETLISACHVLEELNVIGHPWKWKQSHIVSSSTLKRLTLSCKHCDDRFKGPRILSFDTPNLAYLNYCDRVADEYPVVNLDSLVEANLSLDLRESHSQSQGNPENLFEWLSNVEILEFSYDTFKVFPIFSESIPVLRNLSRLSFVNEYRSVCWEFLPLLINKSPNLESLIIKGSLHFFDYYEDGKEELQICKCLSEYSFLSSCPVKFLEISDYKGTKGELYQMEFLLEKLHWLELVKVQSSETDHKKLTKDLLMLIRPPECKIQFEFIPPSSRR